MQPFPANCNASIGVKNPRGKGKYLHIKCFNRTFANLKNIELHSPSIECFRRGEVKFRVIYQWFIEETKEVVLTTTADAKSKWIGQLEKRSSDLNVIQ